MAKNYTISEAVAIIVEGKDLESISDLGKRFPILTAKIAALGAKAGNSFVEFMNYMPEHVTANKVNTIIKNGVQDSDDEDADNEDAEQEKPVKADKKPAAKQESTDDSDYASKSSNALYQILKERGLTKGRKFSKKAEMIEALEEYDKKNSKKAAAEEAEDDEATSEYDEMSPQELFKECKKRGIKVEPKKPAKYYIEKLEADDNAGSEDDDWGDEGSDEDEKPAKTEKKKPVAKKKADEDEDDDWDI